MRITALLSAAGMVAAVVALPFAPSAAAVPGDPMSGCETQIFADYCDGPIREDGSWKRCMFGRSYPRVNNCFIVPSADEMPPTPLGQPPYHID